MKTFLEVVEEIKKSFDQDDASILAAIEDSLETDLTAASIRHLAGTFFVYNKKVYKAIQLIPVGNAIVIGTAGTPGVNAVLAEDIMSLIAGIGDSKFGDFAAVTDVTIDGVIYHTYWKVAPTNSNQVSGLAIHPTTGQLCEVYNNQGTYSLISFTTEIQALTNNDYAIVNELGAKNLLPNEGTSEVKNGITFTINSYGGVRVSGTATADTYFAIKPSTSKLLSLEAGENYILSGCPSGVPTDCCLYFNQTVNGTPDAHYDSGEGVTFTANGSRTVDNVQIFIKSGSDFSSAKTFYPMIRPASIDDNIYVPYAMTSRELTENFLKTSISFTLENDVSSYFSVEQNKSYQTKNIKHIVLSLSVTQTYSNINQEKHIGDINVTTPVSIGGVLVDNRDTTMLGTFFISTGGGVYINLVKSIVQGVRMNIQVILL